MGKGNLKGHLGVQKHYKATLENILPYMCVMLDIANNSAPDHGHV